MCSVFQISRSSYYSWLKNGSTQAKSDQLRAKVKESFKKNKGHYGSPRLAIEMRANGVEVSRSTVARVMRSEGLIARPRAKYVHTTDSDHMYKIADNILNRDFRATRLNEKWVSDITYIHTRKGWTYLTVIIDLADRMVVSWTLSDNMTCQDTTIQALKIALERRTIQRPLLFHSDQGVQYSTPSFTKLINATKWMTQSMSRKGNCWDNAVAESFFKSLKTEWVRNFRYANKEYAQRSIFDYIDRWYNTKRRHSSIGYISPLEKYNSFFNRKAA